MYERGKDKRGCTHLKGLFWNLAIEYVRAKEGG